MHDKFYSKYSNWLYHAFINFIISRLVTQQSLGSHDLQSIPFMGRAAGMQLMATIKENKASNQCNNIVSRFNVRITRVKKWDLLLYIKLTISSLSAVRHTFYKLRLETGALFLMLTIEKQQITLCNLWLSLCLTENNTPCLQKNSICCSVPKPVLKLRKWILWDYILPSPSPDFP